MPECSFILSGAPWMQFLQLEKDVEESGQVPSRL